MAGEDVLVNQYNWLFEQSKISPFEKVLIEVTGPQAEPIIGAVGTYLGINPAIIGIAGTLAKLSMTHHHGIATGERRELRIVS